MIPFKCPMCRERLDVPDSQAGGLETCPTCKAVMEVPWPRTATRRHAAVLEHEIDAMCYGRQSSSGGRRLIWGSVIAAMVFAVLGIVAGVLAPWQIAEKLWGGCMICVVLCAIVAFAAMPGAIARSRGLANADGINSLGILGVFIPVVWLVAVVMALACTPPADARPRL